MLLENIVRQEIKCQQNGSCAFISITKSRCDVIIPSLGNHVYPEIDNEIISMPIHYQLNLPRLWFRQNSTSAITQSTNSWRYNLLPKNFPRLIHHIPMKKAQRHRYHNFQTRIFFMIHLTNPCSASTIRFP